jgi:hypothetical protein
VQTAAKRLRAAADHRGCLGTSTISRAVAFFFVWEDGYADRQR